MSHFIYYATEEELEKTSISYKKILQAYQQLLLDMKISTLIETFYLASIMILNGYFSMDKKLVRDIKYPYVSISNVKDGYQVMSGISACRHANSLLNDLLISAGYHPQKILAVLKEINDKEKEKINHLVIACQETDLIYLLDAFNEIIFQLQKEQIISTNPSVQLKIIKETYSDQIAKTLLNSQVSIQKNMNINGIIQRGDNIFDMFQKEKNRMEDFYETSYPDMKKIRNLVHKYERLQSLGIEHTFE